MNEGEGLTRCRAGYKDSGSRVSKSMYSPLMMRCFTLSGSGGCCAGGADSTACVSLSWAGVCNALAGAGN